MSSPTTLTLENKPLFLPQKLSKTRKGVYWVWYLNYLDSCALNHILGSTAFWKHLPNLFPFHISKRENQKFSVSFNWFERLFCQGKKLCLNPFLNNMSFLKLMEKNHTARATSEHFHMCYWVKDVTKKKLKNNKLSVDKVFFAIPLLGRGFHHHVQFFSRTLPFTWK